MIVLRKLQVSDSKSMLAWMHDSNIIGKLPTRFENMTEDDCRKFILSAETDEKTIHRAVCNEFNDYIGTVSLKNIDYENSTAEFAIVLSKDAIGKEYAKEAVKEILQIAFFECKLNRVYLCVFEDNIRAVRFYEKMQLTYEGMFREHILSKDGKYHNLCWYSILKSEFESRGDCPKTSGLTL